MNGERTFGTSLYYTNPRDVRPFISRQLPIPSNRSLLYTKRIIPVGFTDDKSRRSEIYKTTRPKTGGEGE